MTTIAPPPVTRDCRQMGSLESAEAFETTSSPPIRALSQEQTTHAHSVIAFEMVSLDRASPRAVARAALPADSQQSWSQERFSNGLWRLPSSRALAADLGVSRFTVKLALEQLRTEGYLRTSAGSGTFVADPLPITICRCSGPEEEKRRALREELPSELRI